MYGEKCLRVRGVLTILLLGFFGLGG